MKNVRFAGVLVAAVTVLAGCGAAGSASTDKGTGDDDDTATRAVALSASIENGARNVAVDTVVRASVLHGDFDKVELRTVDGDEAKTINGEFSGDSWVASDMLEPGQQYRLMAAASGDSDAEATLERSFTTEALTLDQQTYASVAPLNGETVGVAMPVVVQFDIAVQESQRALFERKMLVTSDPSVEGSWYWLSDTEVHWRPKEYWPAGTAVSVDLRVNGLPAGNGIYGQKDQKVTFNVGKAVVSEVDVKTHKMAVSISGKHVKTLPVTTGDSQHRSRNGTKVVMAKLPTVDMDAASTGVDAGAPDYYNIKGVKWALRLTNSGEFIHAAPWSEGSHGVANVSHGCTGMSLADANWFYDISHRGDPVTFVNSPRQPEPGNGWTDWNVSWSDWQEGSALTNLS